jgi:hypothetical protein
MTNDSMKAAIDSIANLFDASTKRFIIEHLRDRHGIDLDGDKQVDRKDVDNALSLLFGEAAWIILADSSNKEKRSPQP